MASWRHRFRTKWLQNFAVTVKILKLLLNEGAEEGAEEEENI